MTYNTPIKPDSIKAIVPNAKLLLGARQTLSLLVPSNGVNLPLGQRVQKEDPGCSEKYDAGHKVQVDNPPELKVPGEHSAMLVDPAVDTKAPLGACKQALNPVLGPYLPGSQLVQ